MSQRPAGHGPKARGKSKHGGHEALLANPFLKLKRALGPQKLKKSKKPRSCYQKVVFSKSKVLISR